MRSRSARPRGSARSSAIRSSRPRCRMLAAVMPWVGHAATRARGTIGGSLANADPAAEIALVAVTLGATLIYRDGAETREIAAAEFFIGPMTTALPVSGCLTAVRFPVLAASGADRRRLPRGQRAAERLRLCVGGGAGRARRGRHVPAPRGRHRRGDGVSAAARQRSRRRSPGRASMSRRRARPCTPRSPTSSRSPTCTRRPPIAGALR